MSRWCNGRWWRRRLFLLTLALFAYILWQNAVNYSDVSAKRKIEMNTAAIRASEIDTQNPAREVPSSRPQPSLLPSSASVKRLSPSPPNSVPRKTKLKIPLNTTTKVPTTTTHAPSTAPANLIEKIEKQVSEVGVWILRQRKRRRRITDTCQLVNHSGRILKIPSSSQIYVDRKHQVLYCAIPKAACSSWKVALAQLTGKFNRSDHRQTLYVHDDAFMASIGLHQLRSFSRVSIEEIIKSYRKFIVVRHPFERLVSAFVDKFEKYNKWTQHFHHKFGRQIMHKYRQNATKLDLETGRNVTFQEFVRLITDSEVERGFRLNEHWESFQNLCLPCAIPYDFVVDYDTIEEDNRNLLRGIFMVDDPEKFFPHQNANPGSAELRTLQYMRTLSESSIQRLITTYNTDFTMFNYSWPR